MASRMDRYYEKPKIPKARIIRNEQLYKQIQDLNEYSNIGAVTTISKTNEIDITKVKEMIKNRENYKKEKKYQDALNINNEDMKPKKDNKFLEQERNYDIMDVLSKAKNHHEEDGRNRSLKNTNYDVLKNLNLRSTNYDDSEEELKDLINTITSKKSLDDDIGLFDDLTADTMVGEASSIRKILAEEKRQQEFVDNTAEMDKSFFTSAVSFSKKDFEDLKNMKHNVKRNHLLLIIILCIIFIVILFVVIFIIASR